MIQPLESTTAPAAKRIAIIPYRYAGQAQRGLDPGQLKTRSCVTKTPVYFVVECGKQIIRFRNKLL